MSQDPLDRAEGTTPAEATQQSLAAIVFAITGGIILVIEAFFGGLDQLLEVFAAVRDFFVSFFQAPRTIIEDTAIHTAWELTAGEWAFFGPGTFAVGLISIAIAWWAWNLLDPDIPLVDDIIPWRRGR